MATVGSPNTYTSKALQSSISKEVILSYAKSHPFVAKLKQKGAISIGSTERKKIVKNFGKATTLNVGAKTATDTTITVSAGDGLMFTTNSVLMVNSTQEQLLVIGVSGDNLTVVRGFGETTAQDIPDGAVLIYLGIAYAEGARNPVVRSAEAIETINYTQIFRTPAELTGTAEAVDAVDLEWKLEKQEKFIIHMSEIERSFLFGDLKNDVNRQVRTLKGVSRFIKTNVVDLGGSITSKKVADVVAATVKKNSGQKVLFASSELFTAIEDLAQNVIRVEAGTKKFGATVARWLVGGEDVEIIHDPVLDETGHAGYGFLIDMKHVNYCYLKGRDTMFREFAKDDYDGKRGEYLTECTLEMGDEGTHAIIFNP